MFNPGDVVVYHHRVCKVAAIREDYFCGRDYLELHALFERSLKLFVVLDDAHASAVRPVMTRDEALALIDSIPDSEPIDESQIIPASATATLAERRMREEYERRLKSPEPDALVPILRSAYLHAKRREASGRSAALTDKKYFTLAESLLCDELSLSLGIDREKTQEFLAQRVHEAEERSRGKR